MYLIYTHARNKYGDVDLIIPQNSNQFTEQPDLKMNKPFNCNDCECENVRGELNFGKNVSHRRYL